MTTDQEPPKKPAAPQLPADDLPTLPDRTDTSELMDYLQQSASYYWHCYGVLQYLFNMTEAERRACPDYLAQLQAARLGMSAARQLQEQAKARLEVFAAYPAKWKAWPERRAEPRLDFQ